ncbi:RNA 3'-terminal phosphate cyclase [Candidatus Woesearchaeota archaeon]|nr:RNA 3'-terminal phosphate cyclase [Candidatus Woesearchaeota archaeon]
MIQLDGSFGEGGGSILRQALALSILTGKDFNIKNIRSNRPKPGLSAQHLAALNAAVEVSGATVWGDAIGSTEVYFKPGEYKGGTRRFDIGTAGSITLLLQSVLLPAVFSKKKSVFTITGGTDVSWSAPYDYFTNVFLPQLRRFADIDASLLKRGYYPRGGGELKISINSRFARDNADLPKLAIIEKPNLLHIKGSSHASADLEPNRVSERQAESAKLKLKGIGAPVFITTSYANTPSTGSGIVLWAIYGGEEIDFKNPVIIGSDSLGQPGKRAEHLGIEASEKLMEFISSDAPVDEYLCDQLIPYLAVAGGKIKTNKVTDHTLSNIYVTEKFLDVKFDIKENVVSISAPIEKNSEDTAGKDPELNP